MSYLSINPRDINSKDMHQFIIGAISPRPIALVSTINSMGQMNLAPYSFFNAFSSNPPVLVFSSNLKSGDKKEKDTLINIKETNECVVNLVNFNMSRQMSLTSISYSHGVSEFEKAGLTPLSSENVVPFRVVESPVHIECTVNNIIALGSNEGAANLIICNIVKMHILKNVLTSDLRRIDPNRLDIMGRLGRSNYVRVKGENIISMYQSTQPNCLGYDNLPESIRHSNELTGNQIAELASLKTMPTKTDVIDLIKTSSLMGKSISQLHQLAAKAIDAGNLELGLLLALAYDHL